MAWNMSIMRRGPCQSWDPFQSPTIMKGKPSICSLILRSGLPESNKNNGRLYQRTAQTIFICPTECGRTHLVLDVIEKKYNKHFDYIIIICPTLRWNETYYSKVWIKNDEKFWLIEPKDRLYQWIEKLSQLIARSETLFIIDDIMADESLGKRRQSLLELYISGRYRDHYL